MTAPRLEACYFDQPHESFARLARVLEMTAAEHCSSWHRVIRPIPGPTFRAATGVRSHTCNIQKFREWVRLVDEAADGDRLLLLDADLEILRPLDDVWDRPFDLAYTVKPHRFPFNLGVLFLRVSPPVRTFFHRWLAQNLALAASPGSRAWRIKYGGINQAAFGVLHAEGGLHDLALQTLPCQEWNCEESGWRTFDPAVTRILHVKGALRRIVIGRERVSPECVAAARYWLALDARAAA